MLAGELEAKVGRAKAVIAEAIAKARNPFTTFTGGKDSLVLLHLLRTVGGGSIPVGVLHIDTTVKFPEIYAFIDKMSRMWGFSYVRIRNEDALRRITIAADPTECCMELKTRALHMVSRSTELTCCS